MKKYIIATVIICITSLTTAFAQQRNPEDWRKKMMNEKIAFLTTEIGITPEEGQVFWPVYNQVSQEKDAAMRNMFKAYKALSEGIENEKGSKEIERLLKAYLDAQQEQRELEKVASEKFMKALPVEKVAKLYMAEERFRRQQINRLNHGNHQKNPQK